MKRIIFLIIFILIIPFGIRLLSYFTTDLGNTDNDYNQAFLRSHKTFSIEIPAKVDFAGEATPVQMYDVRERLDRELLLNVYWQSNTVLMFKRAYRWFPIIEPILKRNKIPSDFKYIALIESGFMNKVSPAGAEGFWQFIKETAVKYDLEINDEVDERYNIEKSTEAACKYFKETYKRYDNWTLAAVSYNRGPTGIDKQLDRQKVNNFYDLLLNEESSRYIFRILATKIILTHPTKYGFYLRKKDLYPPIPTYSIQVDSSISNLADFAIKNKINYKILKEFNPWLRDNSLKNKDKKKYNILIPKEEYLKYDLLFDDVDGKNKILNDTVSLDYIK
jgi:membrane-bound lytic murein transglycosylase D